MGFRGRYKNKRDANEGEVVATLRAHGLSVVHLDTPVDLLCGYAGQTWAIEVKDGDAKLTEAQIAFFEAWRGNHTIIRNRADAEAFAREIRRLACGKDLALPVAGAINEARPEGATNADEPLTETSTSGGARMADNGQYTDSASVINPEQNGNWQSIGDLARALAEKASGK